MNLGLIPTVHINYWILYYIRVVRMTVDCRLVGNSNLFSGRHDSCNNKAPKAVMSYKYFRTVQEINTVGRKMRL